MAFWNLERRGAHIIAGAALVLAAACSQRAVAQSNAGVSGWGPPERVVLSERELLFNEPFDRHFGSRAFHFIGILDSGVQYLLNVFRWEYAGIGGWGTSVLLTGPDGLQYACERRVPEREMQVAADRFLLRWGDNECSGEDGDYRIRMHLGDFACDMRVHALLKPWRPGNGTIFEAEGGRVFMRQAVSSPWALTSGWMRLADREYSAVGQCYTDRSRYTFPIGRLNTALVAFRAFSPAQTEPAQRWFVSLLHHRTHEAYGPADLHELLLGHGGRWVLATGSAALRGEDLRLEMGTDIPFPHRLLVRAECEGYCLDGQFVATRLTQFTDVLQRIPSVFRPAAAMFLRRPVIIRATGYFAGTLVAPDGRTGQLLLQGQCEYYQVK